MTDEASFEELQKELDAIVTRLERGDVPVDDAIALFERGEELYRACAERLQAAELRIEELSPGSDGRRRTRAERVTGPPRLVYESPHVQALA